MRIGALPDGRANAPETSNTLLAHYPLASLFDTLKGDAYFQRVSGISLRREFSA